MLQSSDLSIKLGVLWVRIHHCGWCAISFPLLLSSKLICYVYSHVSTSKKGCDAGTVGLFVEEMINTSSALGADMGLELEPTGMMDNFY
jgi:hypothetical protein